jgi:hypothetical protein
VFRVQETASLLTYKLLDPSQQATHIVPVHASELTFVGPPVTVVHVFPVVLYATDEDPPATHVVPLFKTALNIYMI